MRRIILCLVLATSIFACKEQKEDASSIKGFFTAIIVSDIENSIHWYKNNLDFQIKKQRGSIQRKYCRRSTIKQKNDHRFRS